MNLWIGKANGLVVAEASLLKLKEAIASRSGGGPYEGEWTMQRCDIGKPSQEKVISIICGDNYIESVAETKRFRAFRGENGKLDFSAIRSKKGMESSTDSDVADIDKD